jgi:hypothetical protein
MADFEGVVYVEGNEDSRKYCLSPLVCCSGQKCGEVREVPEHVWGGVEGCEEDELEHGFPIC